MTHVSRTSLNCQKVSVTLSTTVSTHTFGDKTLLLRKGEGWRDAYFETIILPLLRGEILPNAEPVVSSQFTQAWKVYTDKSIIFVKLYLFRGMKDKLLFFRKSRAQRDMEGGAILLQKGFHAPSLIAQGDIRKGVRVLNNFLITEWIEGLNVYAYMRTYFQAPFSGEILPAKRNFIRVFGTLIGQLHKNGISHGDLRAGNVLINRMNNNYMFFFIDNERNKCSVKGIPMRLRLKNLVQLNMIVNPHVTFTDRLRFFKAYLDENLDLNPTAKNLVRTVHVKTVKRLKRKHLHFWEKNWDGENKNTICDK